MGERAVTDHRQIGDGVILQVRGTIEGTTTAGGEITAYRIRLGAGGEIDLTPEQLSAATGAERVSDLLLQHLLTGEPLGSHEVAAIEAAGLAPASDFDMTGGDLFRHVLLQDEEE